jgi:hypothetical protein
VDESAQGIRTHQSEQPQYEKDYKDCPKHAANLLRLFSLFASTTEHWKQMRWEMVVCAKKEFSVH